MSHWCNDCAACAVGPCKGSCPVEFFRGLFFTVLVILSPVALVPVGLLIGKVASVFGTARGPFLTWGRCWMLLLCIGAMVAQAMAAFFALYAHTHSGDAFELYQPPPPNTSNTATATPMVQPMTVVPPLQTSPPPPAGTAAMAMNETVATRYGLVAPCDARWVGIGMFSSGHESTHTTVYFSKECAGAESGDSDRPDMARLFTTLRGLQVAAIAATYLGFIALNALANVIAGGCLLLISGLLQLVLWGIITRTLYRDDFCGSGRSLRQLGFVNYVGFDVQPYALVFLFGALSLVFGRIVDRAADPDAPDYDAEPPLGYDDDEADEATRYERHMRQRAERRRRGLRAAGDAA